MIINGKHITTKKAERGWYSVYADGLFIGNVIKHTREHFPASGGDNKWHAHTRAGSVRHFGNYPFDTMKDAVEVFADAMTF